MTDLTRIEAIAGPLPRRREWERWCEYTQPLSLPERGKADAALAEAYEKIQELDDKLMEAEGAHENARRWFEEQKKQFARAEKAIEYARIEIKRKNEAVEREAAAIERAEKAEAENERLTEFLGEGYVQNCIIEGGSLGGMFVCNDAGIIPKLDGFLIRKLDLPSPAVLVPDFSRLAEEKSCP
jgi:hypothetical protein